MFSNASNITTDVDKVFLFIIGISAILLALITFFMVYFLIKYNKKRHIHPENIEGNTLLEIIWVIVPTIIVLAMFYYGWEGFNDMRNVPKEAMVVRVTARMWSWFFEYENGKTSDLLNVPVSKPVKLVLTSQDVIHSFYIPAFRVKEDAVPGMETYLWFLAKKTGTYDVLCAEYCGLAHSHMLSKVVVMPDDEFGAWYSGKAEVAKAKEGVETPVELLGQKLIQTKGCMVCHSIDGTKLIGPTLKGVYGKKTEVITAGKEREIIADDEYLRRSILEPGADVVEGFPPVMPSQKDILTDQEIKEIIEYLKQLK